MKNTLYRLGIVISTNEKGYTDIQRIDNPEEWKKEHNLDFLPPLLSGDREAREIFNNNYKTKGT